MAELLVRPKPARVGAAAAGGGRLSVNAGSHAISKSTPPPPAAPKIRIIHLSAPEIIQTDAANFRDLVQRLTGKQAIARAESERKQGRKSKGKKARPGLLPQPQQQLENPAAAIKDVEGAGLARQQSLSSVGGETSDSVDGSSFGQELEVLVKQEQREVMEEDIWFGRDYVAAVGNGAAGSSCSGSDVGTDVSCGGAEFDGFVDLDEFVQGFYEYQPDSTIACSTVYTDLFGDSPVSGC